MDRYKLIEALDSLCWSARRYGHDDYGLDFAVDENGCEVSDDYPGNTFHPEAVAWADAILKEFNNG